MKALWEVVKQQGNKRTGALGLSETENQAGPAGGAGWERLHMMGGWTYSCAMSTLLVPLPGVAQPP